MYVLAYQEVYFQHKTYTWTHSYASCISGFLPFKFIPLSWQPYSIFKGFIVIFAEVLPSLAICSSPGHALSQDAVPVPAEKPHSESCISDKPHSSMGSLSLVAH